MANEPVVPVAPAPAPVVAPVTPTFAQQVVDSQVAPAAPAAPAAAPAVKPAGEAPAPSAPPAAPDDSALKAQLADAEKRLQDTQRWGHKNAQEAAQLKTELAKIQNHPVVGKLLEVMATTPQQVTGNPQVDADRAEVQAAWTDYQTSKSDEEAFTKILKFAETRAAKRAMTETNKALTERENASRIQQRNQQTVQLINKTVTESAPDVPLELFWALSGRAESETPATITEYAERLQWQTGRAIDLSRAVLQPRIAQATQAGATQAAVTQQAGAIMPPGGAAPGVQTPAAPVKPKTMAEFIKDMQRSQMGPQAK